MDKNRIKGLKLLSKKKVKFPSSPEKAKLEVFDISHPERDYWIGYAYLAQD